jgi:hypothetical protein
MAGAHALAASPEENPNRSRAMTWGDLSGCAFSLAGTIGGLYLGQEYGLFWGAVGVVVGYFGGGLFGAVLAAGIGGLTSKRAAPPESSPHDEAKGGEQERDRES